MKKSEEFLKNIKKGGIGKLIVGIVLILMGICSLANFYFLNQKEKKNPIDLYNANESGQYVKLDVHFLLDYFASSTVHPEQKDFIAYDENNVMYIVELSEKDIEKLQEILDYTYAEEEPEEIPESVTIYGKTVQIDSSLRKLTISYYNEIAGEDFLTNSNFDKYFGKYYLDTNIGSTNSYLIYGVISSGIFCIIGLTFIIRFALHKNKNKKLLEKYKDNMYELLNSIDSETCYYNKKTKVYFTNNCIINYINGLDIIDYKDIVWIYPHEDQCRGSVTKSIYVVTKDSRIHILSQLNMNKKTRLIFDEAYQTLINRNPKVLLGYSTENAQKARELYIKK